MTTLYLRQIAFVARALEPVMDDITAVLGVNICFRDEGVGTFGLENALVTVGTQFIEVVAPTEEGTAGGRYLDRRGGDGGYMIICQTENQAAQQELRTRAEGLGIRVAWEREHEWGRFMQLHPRDTGGTFFEIDCAEPFEPEGLWPPAGGPADKWRDTIRTDVSRAIVAAELQSDDPLALAERWGAISGVPVVNGAGGLEMQLANARIRFVEARDGRGEGLGGIDIAAPGKAAALSAATARGLDTQGDQVMVCGVRVNLV